MSILAFFGFAPNSPRPPRLLTHGVTPASQTYHSIPTIPWSTTSSAPRLTKPAQARPCSSSGTNPHSIPSKHSRIIPNTGRPSQTLLRTHYSLQNSVKSPPELGFIIISATFSPSPASPPSIIPAIRSESAQHPRRPTTESPTT